MAKTIEEGIGIILALFLHGPIGAGTILMLFLVGPIIQYLYKYTQYIFNILTSKIICDIDKYIVEQEKTGHK